MWDLRHFLWLKMISKRFTDHNSDMDLLSCSCRLWSVGLAAPCPQKEGFFFGGGNREKGWKGVAKGANSGRQEVGKGRSSTHRIVEANTVGFIGLEREAAKLIFATQSNIYSNQKRNLKA